MERSSGHSHGVITALAAGLALALGGCGGSSSKPAAPPVKLDARSRQYLSAMCAATLPVHADFTALPAALAQAKNSDLAQYKANILPILGKVTADAGQATEALQHAGTPDFTGGAIIARGVISEFANFHLAFARALTWAKAFSTSNVNQFELALGGMQIQLQQALAAAGGTVNAVTAELSPPGLAAAQRSVPACHAKTTVAF